MDGYIDAMHYLLTPLHTHIDFGFGATGDAFLTAATKLESEGSPRPGLGNQHLPINFLRRHALELFLKSGIVIIHRKLKLPYGELPHSGSPHAFDGGKWVQFHHIHSVKRLWKYLASLFHEHKAFFDSIGPKDLWTFPPEMDTWIEEIEHRDPISTFFRYPTLRSPDQDIKKASMHPANENEISKRLETSSEGPKQFILLMKDDNSNVTGGYYYEGEPLADFNRLLQECVNQFSGLHVAMRVELCGVG
ncbi:MAG: hypothetical protein NPIRA03_29260 [Nitrospirales bacterium]|nr:MAG: hypothetical protein NPIRA03_29260 [Nitrospirales bacterium]